MKKIVTVKSDTLREHYKNFKNKIQTLFKKLFVLYV